MDRAIDRSEGGMSNADERIVGMLSEGYVPVSKSRIQFLADPSMLLSSPKSEFERFVHCVSTIRPSVPIFVMVDCEWFDIARIMDINCGVRTHRRAIVSVCKAYLKPEVCVLKVLVRVMVLIFGNISRTELKCDSRL